MARQKNTRRLTDIMPARKADKHTDASKRPSGRKATRYELDAKAREEKKKRKHKGLTPGSRHSAVDNSSKVSENRNKMPVWEVVKKSR